MAVKAHYESSRWVDYARGLGSREERAAMEGHAASCASCRRAAERWSRLAVIAREDAAKSAPPGVLRRAGAIFVSRAPEKAPNAVQILAQVVYDSFRDPLPVGLRAEDRPSQIRFEAGPYALDLHLNRERLDRETTAGRMVLVGQIVHRGRPDKRMGDLPILIVKGREVVACGTSNEWGEFHLEYDPRKRVRLQIPVGPKKRIEVPLPRSSHWRKTP